MTDVIRLQAEADVQGLEGGHVEGFTSRFKILIGKE